VTDILPSAFTCRYSPILPVRSRALARSIHRFVAEWRDIEAQAENAVECSMSAARRKMRYARVIYEDRHQMRDVDMLTPPGFYAMWRVSAARCAARRPQKAARRAATEY